MWWSTSHLNLWFPLFITTLDSNLFLRKRLVEAMFHIDTCPFLQPVNLPRLPQKKQRLLYFFLLLQIFFGKENINMYIHTYILFNVCIHICICIVLFLLYIWYMIICKKQIQQINSPQLLFGVKRQGLGLVMSRCLNAQVPRCGAALAVGLARTSRERWRREWGGGCGAPGGCGRVAFFVMSWGWDGNGWNLGGGNSNIYVYIYIYF